MKIFKQRILALLIATLLVVVSGGLSSVLAAALPGGTLDPNTVPKYVTPLVIPPVMPATGIAGSTPQADLDIAVRQFKQQILPGGIWNLAGGYAPLTYTYPATTVWSYGSASDPMPDSSAQGGGVGIAPAGNSSFNYPAFTVENQSGTMNKVRWINELVKDPVVCYYGTATGTSCNYLAHILPVDQTLHWANPANADCFDHTTGLTNPGTDCETLNQLPYMGPVPIVTHVHGAHVNPESDGYPEAWWLANADNIPGMYATGGTRFGQWMGDGVNSVAGSAFFAYENDQEATTLWYHDHSMGMTRLNVYAGPAGFWLIRGGAHGDSMVVDASTGAPGLLPGPAPVAADATLPLNIVGNATRNKIREIPIVFQDRSFDWVNAAGTPVPQGDPSAVGTGLWYPTSRIDFDGYDGPSLGDPAGSTADISKIWNPEAFFNTFVVNGVTWPKLEVAAEQYRFRLLNGCNSRTINLAMRVVTPGADGTFGTVDDVLGAELPFFQIGGDQGFLPSVTMIQTGFIQQLVPGALTLPTPVVSADPEAALQGMLLMPAERADVIVDFTGIANGTHIRITNTADDGPFSGLLGAGLADEFTTGQVMEFVVDTLIPAGAASTPVTDLALPADIVLGPATNTRKVSLNELVSNTTCIAVDAGTGEFVHFISTDPNLATDTAAQAACVADAIAWGNAQVPPITATGDLAGPRQALLGDVVPDPGGVAGGLVAVPQRWTDPITTNPLLGSTEIWEIYNTTADAHPIHVHLVRFEIVEREDLTIDANGVMTLTGLVYSPRDNELGFKDTVVAYKEQVTRLKAKFDILGLYVWHCHIVEHEDNEMMLPFEVVPATVEPPTLLTVPATSATGDYTVSWTASPTGGVTYVLQESSDNFVTTTDIPVAGLSTLITGKGNNPFTFSYQVYAVHPVVGNSAPTAASSILVTLPAAAPASVTVPATSNNGSYNVSWTASTTPGATYTLEESILAGFPSGSITTVGSNIAALTSPIAGKADGVTYYYRVSATAPNYSLSAPTEGTNGCAVTILTTTVTAPTTGQSFALGTAFNVTATASTPVGFVIGSVDFYDNGLLVGGSTVSPYTFAYTPVGAGSHNLTAITNYVGGATSSSPAVSVTVTGIAAPVFTTSATAGAIDFGSSVILSATPVVVTGASVNLVMFKDGATPVGSVLGPVVSPYDYVWSPTTGGLKSLTAVVYYSNGQLATSAVVPLTVNTVVAAPASITVPAISPSGNYTVTWTPSATLGVTYILQESTDSGFATFTTPAFTGTTATITGKPYNTYYYRVKAVKSPMADSPWVSASVVVPINVALASNGGIATASSTDPRNTPASVNNGERAGLNFYGGGGWLDNTPGVFPDWVQINFSGVNTINEIDVYHVQDDWTNPVTPTVGQTFTLWGAKAFDVQYWDGLTSTWVTVPGGSFTNNNLAWNKITFPPVSTDQIRVRVNGSRDGHSRIVELEAFSTNATPVPSAVVTLTAPTNGAVYPVAPTTITLSANVITSNGWNASRVDYYAGTTLIGTSTTGPTYSVDWTNVPAGIYTLTAKAVESLGYVSTSSVTGVIVGVVPINVALASNGGISTASSSDTRNTPASINNGERTGLNFYGGGGWMDNTPGVFPDWIQINFSGVNTINEIDVYHVQDDWTNPVTPTVGQTFTLWGAKAFDVQYWDGLTSTWVTVPGGSFTNNNLAWNKITFPPVSTDQIRVRVNGSRDGYSRIVELEAFSAP